MKRIAMNLFAALLIGCLTCASVWAQATAQISGTVKDQTGAVLPGDEVTATQTETGVARMAITNETGSYVLSSLPVGPYKLEAAFGGISTFGEAWIFLPVDSTSVVYPFLGAWEVPAHVAG